MRDLTPRQRHVAKLELLSAKDDCRGKPRWEIYLRACDKAEQRAIEAARIRLIDDCHNLCKVSDYFTRRYARTLFRTN